MIEIIFENMGVKSYFACLGVGPGMAWGRPCLSLSILCNLFWIGLSETRRFVSVHVSLFGLWRSSRDI
jgi:hypothetical protein